MKVFKDEHILVLGKIGNDMIMTAIGFDLIPVISTISYSNESYTF